ncbi:hypothetical protein [Desulfofundulus sp.]|uniref:hypothetical protein n=1 Tax=Desulfofundulus sp. TaxID=2282750 RepID=UPI003C777A85
MSDRDFLLSFGRFKNEFLRQAGLEKNQYGVLDAFEKWLRMYHNNNVDENDKVPPSGIYLDVHKDREVLLNEICRRVEQKLLQRGIVVKCISAARWGKARSSALCLVLPGFQDVFYRLCFTQPRKGIYSGRKILMSELVLDGHKKSLFLPLLNYHSEMERRLDFRLERESLHMEQAGRYRFKICFPVEQEKIPASKLEEIARVVARFIIVSSEYLEKVNAAQIG